jgi:hypothetical protein
VLNKELSPAPNWPNPNPSPSLITLTPGPNLSLLVDACNLRLGQKTGEGNQPLTYYIPLDIDDLRATDGATLGQTRWIMS